MTRKFGWSKNVLIHQIENQSYEKSLLGQTNFDQALTPELRAQGKLAVKDEYTFDFLELGEEHSERELERARIACLVPEDHEREQLMQGIYEGVKAGNYPLARQRFEAVSMALQERYGVSTLIMGCTEIPLALSEHPWLEGIALVNPSVVLASALARHAYCDMPTEGIAQAARAIDHEASQLQANMGESAAAQLDEIALHIQRLSSTLGEVVPYLGQLSQDMDAGVARVTSDIIDTLGDMQFQDINRQLLEQINHALGSLSAHFAQLYQLIDGQAPPPPVQLEELLQLWTKDYVMHAQRVAHVLAASPARRGSAEVIPINDPKPVELAVVNGPRIELF